LTFLDHNNTWKAFSKCCTINRIDFEALISLPLFTAFTKLQKYNGFIIIIMIRLMIFYQHIISTLIFSSYFSHIFKNLTQILIILEVRAPRQNLMYNSLTIGSGWVVIYFIRIFVCFFFSVFLMDNFNLLNTRRNRKCSIKLDRNNFKKKAAVSSTKTIHSNSPPYTYFHSTYNSF